MVDPGSPSPQKPHINTGIYANTDPLSQQHPSGGFGVLVCRACSMETARVRIFARTYCFSVVRSTATSRRLQQTRPRSDNRRLRPLQLGLLCNTTFACSAVLREPFVYAAFSIQQGSPDPVPLLATASPPHCHARRGRAPALAQRQAAAFCSCAV